MLTPKHPEDFKPEIAKDQRLFVVVPYRAMNDKRFTIQRMRALLTICSYANHKGNAWPSIQRMADDMGISKPTMKAHIDWLTQRGYLITVNNSYTVGKHAKPRAIVYDPNNPPHPDDWHQANQDKEQQEQETKAITKERDKLVLTNKSNDEVLAKPTSLYRVWQEALAVYGISHQYDKKLYTKLSHRYTLEGFKKATQVLINSRGRPPASVSIMLRS